MLAQATSHPTQRTPPSPLSPSPPSPASKQPQCHAPPIKLPSGQQVERIHCQTSPASNKQTADLNLCVVVLVGCEVWCGVVCVRITATDKRTKVEFELKRSRGRSNASRRLCVLI